MALPKPVRRYLALALLCAIVAKAAPCGSPHGSAGPQDAPTSTLYGNGSYPWAETMVPWQCVFNIIDYAGKPDAAFAAAQAAAVAAGGGVVYFPAGTYAFTENIQLASNVVIRGVATTARAKNGKAPGPLAPTTVFECADRAHQGILNADPNATALGVVNIELRACAVMLWPGLLPAAPSPIPWPSSLKTYWYGATAVAGQGSRKLVLGNKVHDVVYGRADPTNPASQPWPWRFSTAVAVYADVDSLIANNLISQAESSATVDVSFKGDNVTSRTVPFPYDSRYGIDMKQMLGGVIGHVTGVSVRDNYAWGCGRVGYSIYSGCPDSSKPVLGAGTALLNNHAEHCVGSYLWSVDGVNIATGHDTDENRGYDVSGCQCLNATSNSGHIYRQYVDNGRYLSVDGEGILSQASNGANAVANLFNSNDFTHTVSDPTQSGYIQYYKLYSVSNCVITNNKVDSDQAIGGIGDAAHNGWTGNSCSGNSPAATWCPDGKTCVPCASK